LMQRAGLDTLLCDYVNSAIRALDG
jgi:hypothetical protein